MKRPEFSLEVLVSFMELLWDPDPGLDPGLDLDQSLAFEVFRSEH